MYSTVGDLVPICLRRMLLKTCATSFFPLIKNNKGIKFITFINDSCILEKNINIILLNIWYINNTTLSKLHKYCDILINNFIFAAKNVNRTTFLLNCFIRIKSVPRSRCDSDFAQAVVADCCCTTPAPTVPPRCQPAVPSRPCRIACF